MAKARINKFIFKDGKVFLRLKATANGLKITKDGTHFKMIFTIKGGKTIELPIQFMDDFHVPEAIYQDALQLGFKESDIDQFKSSLVKVSYSWGELICFNAATETSEYFYLVPTEQTIAVRIGPVPNTVDTQQFEMDWTNVQWGYL